MNSQGGHSFQVKLLLASRTVSINSTFYVAMLLKKVFGELVRVEEYIKTDLAGKDAPLVLLDQVSPHLKAILEFLTTKFAFGLVS